jgi:PST family polysaccharide transporter
VNLQKNPELDELEQQTRRGISWNFAAAVVTNLLRLASLAVLGRALTSDDFGVVAVGVAVNVLIHGVRDIGVGPALVQRKELLPGHLTTAFAVSVYVGVALAAAVFLAAPLIGAAYNMPASIDVIRALSVLFALRSFSTVSRVACQRAMWFKSIAIVDLVAFAAGSIVSMITALNDAGPWALVAGYAVEEVLSSGFYLVLTPPTFSLRIDRARLRELLHFGGGHSVVQSANIVALYADNLIVGNGLGARDLGFYTRAFDLIRFPSMVFEAIVGSVLFPALSRVLEDPGRLAASFRRVIFVNALVLLPASAALIVLAPEVLLLLLGPGWDNAVAPFQILALTVLLRTNQKLGGIIAQAAGRVNALAIISVAYMTLLMVGAAIMVRWGINGVATSTAVSITLMSVGCCVLGIQVSGLPVRKFFSSHIPGLVLSLIIAAILYPVISALRSYEAPLLERCLVATVVALGTGAAVTWTWLRRGRGDFAWLRIEIDRVVRRR